MTINVAGHLSENFIERGVLLQHWDTAGQHWEFSCHSMGGDKM